jgi:hypothetical protein
MPKFFEGLLFVVMVFVLCVALAIVIKLTYLWLEEKRKIESPKVQEPTIYLVKQTQTAPTNKRRKKRSPKIAFEGLVLKPENVKLANNTNEEIGANKSISF